MSGEFRTIVADPPWQYSGGGPKAYAPDGNFEGRLSPASGVDSAQRYGAMSSEEICALQPPAAENAHLYLWTTNSFMVEAHEVARVWGFEPKTILTWGKVKQDGSPSMKMGYYFRGATEHVVFAVRGSLRLRTERALPTLLLWPRIPGHSVKPDAFYDLVEEASPGPFLELFARRARLGWERWGDEADSTVELAATLDAGEGEG